MRLLPLVLLACAAPEEAPAPADDRTCDGAGPTEAFVVQQMWFERTADGVSEGFDLDGATSVAGSAEGCGITDQVGPDGESGIDNAFAYLLPALELTEAAAVEDLIQDAIDGGQLLITVDLEDLDDPVDDACVDVTLGRATGEVMLGTDGMLLPGQTLDRDLASPSFSVDGVPLAGGTTEVRPVELDLPVTIFDVDLQFALLDGALRVERRDDGTASGVLAAGVDIAYLLQVAQEENVDPDLHGILEGLLYAWADLAPDEGGACTQLSIVFGFEAVPVFFFEE